MITKVGETKINADGQVTFIGWSFRYDRDIASCEKEALLWVKDKILKNIELVLLKEKTNAG